MGQSGITARLGTAILISILCIAGLPNGLIGTSGLSALSGGSIAYADTCYTSPNATNSGTTGGQITSTSGYTTRDVSTNISFNTTHLTTGDICGGTNYYWVGLQGPSSGGSNCSGGLGFAQVGWVAYGDSGTQGPQYYLFTEYYDGTSNTGCGDHVVYYNGSNGTPTCGQSCISGSGRTYQVQVTAYPNANGCSVGQIQLSLDGTVYEATCVQWGGGNVITDETERYGLQTHIGAIGYWYAQWCQTSGGGSCSPHNAITWSSSNTYQEPYYTYVDISTSNFNTCDNRDFTLSTC